MRILITGAAGFIGGHVVTAIRAAGYDVVALDSLHPAAHRERAMPEGVLMGDVRDPVVVASAMRGVDAVVHQAAMVGSGVNLDDMPEYVSCNDLGTAVLLAAMARANVRRLVLASSMVVYGEGAYDCVTHGGVKPGPRRAAAMLAGLFEPMCPQCGDEVRPGLVPEDAPLDPRSVYAATKLAQENLAGAWAHESGSMAIALRYHNVYGPNMPRDTPYAGVAAIFRSALERREAVRVFEDGAQRRDFIHVTDVARANLAALSRMDGHGHAPGLRAYNIASGEPHTVGEMAEALTSAFGGPAPAVTGEFRSGDVRHVIAASQRARNELDFTAKVSFYDGMKELATAPLRA
jgi:dTDP-L-rhamnose 4-epimerase